MAGRESVDEKIARIVGDALDLRERKQREASDPKARFEGVMGRLEKFLDGLEDPGDADDKPRRRGRRRDDDEDDDGGDFVKSLFG